MQLSLKKRFSQQFSFLASYTLSKTLDDVSSFNITGSAAQSTAGENDLAQNPFDLKAERGRSIFDARHRFVLSYQWNLPFWRQPENWYQTILGNWQVNGITTFMTGTPFTVYDSRDVSLQGGAPEISGFSSDRPDLIGDPNNGPRTTAEWFNTGAFQQLQPGGQAARFGNEGRNVVEGPGFTQWDFSAIKNIPHPRVHVAAVPRRVFQHLQPDQLPAAQQRHQLPQFRQNPGRLGSAPGPVSPEISLLR